MNALAWIGGREALVERAVEQAGTLLLSSRCPVFTFDTDVHGTRAAIALAERVGAAYDHVDGAALARDTALLTDRGGMFIAPGEASRRADLVVIVGKLPEAHDRLVSQLATTGPDLPVPARREFFLVGDGATRMPSLGDHEATALSCQGPEPALSESDGDGAPLSGLLRKPPLPLRGRGREPSGPAGVSSPLRSGGEVAAKRPERGANGDPASPSSEPVLSCSSFGLNGVLAALRAQYAGRQVAVPVSNFDRFASALAAARFPVFIFSGHGCDGLALEMLQGLISDINRTARAPGLHLPASDRGWGSVLASTWLSGFPPRTGFGRGFPEYDPWRFDVARMIAAGEADFHLWISSKPNAAAEPNTGTSLVALTKTAQPIAGAAVTIAIGEAGIDHDAVVYSSLTGSLVSVKAPDASPLPFGGGGHPLDSRPCAGRGGAAMLTRIAGGDIIDPVNGRVGKGDLWIRDETIVEPPPGGEADQTFDASGCIVLAGAIDIHSHIGGGNVNTARLLLPEQHPAHSPRPAVTPLSNAGWSTFQTGCLYAGMGFTTVVEPAMSPSAALHTHLELADIPIIDKATLAILGNDDFLLSMIRDDASPRMIEDYVAWTVASTRALGVKVINAGAAAAFKENVRTFSLDDVVPSYGVSSRKIVKTLQAAVTGSASRIRCMFIATISARPEPPKRPPRRSPRLRAAAASRPSAVLRLWHGGKAQVFVRRRPTGGTGERHAGSDHRCRAGHVRPDRHRFLRCDAAVLARGTAHPKKSVIYDGDGNGGGIVPFRYRQDFYGTLQWAIGLELFLLITDPWRVFFTTDHPNGAPFTTYPRCSSC